MNHTGLVEKRAEQIRAHLNVSEMMAFFVASSFMGAKEEVFQILLAHLRVFETTTCNEDLVQANWIEPQQCYKNAVLLSQESSPANLMYCEGWGFKPSLIPLSHAWVCNAQGQALDVTWQKHYPRENVLANEYVGFVFSSEGLMDLLETSQSYGIMESPRSFRALVLEPARYLIAP